MRKKLVVGNWKMNMSQPEAISLGQALLSAFASMSRVSIAVCPTYLCIPKMNDLLKQSAIMLGAQDCFWKDKGAFTGQISASMLADAGVKCCIVGHSETRGRFGVSEVDEKANSYFGESDFTVNLKLKALLSRSLAPILCVGETLAEREAGKTDEVIENQLRRSLEGVDGAEFCAGVVAYEPVWAIGTGEVCDAKEASRVCGFIRDTLTNLFGEEDCSDVRVLYGGSVKSSNSRELFQSENIDGGLVGGASLKLDEFQRIVLSAT